jgi:NAD+ kinase
VTTLAAPKRVGLTYNPQQEEARAFAYDLARELDLRGVPSALIEDLTPANFDGFDLVICFGGDGTVLQTARMMLGNAAAILGVNTGRLGFLTEFGPDEVTQRLDEVLAGGGRLEERTMLRAHMTGSHESFHGLNEAVIGRATISRAIQLAVDVDGIRIADYRCDGVIVATATGSTAYALSVGGPILPPESSDLVIVPVAPHLASQHAVVVPSSETVHVTLEPRQQAVLSVDGFADVHLSEGDSVTVRASEYRARFLRLNPRTDFYQRMAAQLGWHRPGGNATPLPHSPLSVTEGSL